MNHSRFVIYNKLDGRYRFRLYSSRGKILLTGKYVKSRAECINDIQHLYRLISSNDNFTIVNDCTGVYFHVTDSEKRVLATSEPYRTMPGAGFGINSVRNSVITAVIEDHSMSVRFFTR